VVALRRGDHCSIFEGGGTLTTEKETVAKDSTAWRGLTPSRSAGRYTRTQRGAVALAFIAEYRT
jgi:hypothetical protein